MLLLLLLLQIKDCEFLTRLCSCVDITSYVLVKKEPMRFEIKELIAPSNIPEPATAEASFFFASLIFLK